MSWRVYDIYECVGVLASVSLPSDCRVLCSAVCVFGVMTCECVHLVLVMLQ